MNALTLTQPWATLVALGAKRLETRSWKTSYRGPLAIHAAKGFPAWAREMCETDPFWSALGGDEDDYETSPLMWHELPTGVVVAVCDLVAIYPTENVFCQPALTGENFYSQEDRLYLSPEEWAFGDYNAGRFAWRLENIRPLTEAIPAKGALSLWEWDGVGLEVRT